MRLAICDGQALFAAVLSDALGRQGHEVVLTTDDAGELLDAAADVRPELVVLDTPATTEQLRSLHPTPYVVLLADAQDAQAWDAYDDGAADAVVSKTCGLRTLVEAVDVVANGNHVAEGRPSPDRRRAPVVVEPLTTRELEVLRLVVRGYSTQRMADQLGVSTHTVRTHVQQILRKLGVHGRGKIAGAAARAGLVDVQELVADGHR